MGRARSANPDLARFPRLRRRKLKGGERYYYDHPSGWREPLGSDFIAALERCKRIKDRPAERPRTIADELETWRLEKLPELAQGTQYAYTRAILRLHKVFGKCDWEQITKPDLKKYIALASAKTRAKRDIACLSSCWSWALDSGRTAVPNPRFGMKFSTKREDRKIGRYVTHAELQSVYSRGDAILQDALDLLYYSGQDVRVVLSWRREHLHWDEGVLDTTRTKTQRPMRIELYHRDGSMTEFAKTIKRALERPRRAQSLYIVSGEDGQPVTYMMLWNRFRKARKAAGVDFELRQIRPKTGSDSATLQDAQALLGHEDSKMTRRHYRRGERVRPLK